MKHWPLDKCHETSNAKTQLKTSSNNETPRPKHSVWTCQAHHSAHRHLRPCSFVCSIPKNRGYETEVLRFFIPARLNKGVSATQHPGITDSFDPYANIQPHTIKQVRPVLWYNSRRKASAKFTSAKFKLECGSAALA